MHQTIRSPHWWALSPSPHQAWSPPSHAPVPPPSHQTGDSPGAKDEAPCVPGCGLCLVGEASPRVHVWDKKWVKVDLHGQPSAQQPPHWLTGIILLPPGGCWRRTPLVWSPLHPSQRMRRRSSGFPLGTHISSPKCSAPGYKGTPRRGLMSTDLLSGPLIGTPLTRKTPPQRTKPSPAELIILLQDTEANEISHWERRRKLLISLSDACQIDNSRNTNGRIIIQDSLRLLFRLFFHM